MHILGLPCFMVFPPSTPTLDFRRLGFKHTETSLWGYVLNFEVATAKVHNKMLLGAEHKRSEVCPRSAQRFRNLRGSWHSNLHAALSNLQLSDDRQFASFGRGARHGHIWNIWNIWKILYMHTFFWLSARAWLSRFLNWAQLSKKRRAHTVRRTLTATYWLQLTVFESQSKHWICLLETVIEGSLEVKLPTIWTDEKQRWKGSERRVRLEERRVEEKESEERRCRCAKR